MILMDHYIFLEKIFTPVIREREGRTFVLPRGTAETLGYHQYEYTCRMVTLEVHSSLAAVGEERDCEEMRSDHEFLRALA